MGAKKRGLEEDEEVEALENYIKDYILGEQSDNSLLNIYISYIIEERKGRYLFPNPLDEPVFYRRIKRWVEEGLEERQRYLQQVQTAKKQTG
ncbi:MAG: hypothetical protein N2235_23800 [Fischerella sp.]|nr:hypothetical protein [Fischerella sp.]